MKQEDFCELAALYLLDLLDASQRGILEEALLNPECETTLTELRDAMGAYAYSAPVVTMAPNLKERLFQQIASEANPHNISTLTQQASEVEWEAYPTPGIMFSILHIDPDKREITCFLRVNPGTYFPHHVHAGIEELIVLEGDLVVDGKIYGSGDFIYSHAGSAHQPQTINGCLLFIRTSLDDQILS